MFILLKWYTWKGRIRNDDDPGSVLPSFRIIPRVTEAANLTYNGSKIPRIIHQIWKTHEVPYAVKDWVQTWTKVNPTWEYWFWTDEDMRNLVARKYPSFLNLYDSYPFGLYRADAFRYFLMYEHGGLYADLDAECLKPLDPIISRHACIITQEPLEHAHFLNSMSPPLVCNAVIACQSRHAFFHSMISNLRSFVGVFHWNDVLHATGPYMMTEVFKKYNQYPHWVSSSHRDPLFLAGPDTFLPTVDNGRLTEMRKKCANPGKRFFPSKEFLELQQKLCQKLRRTTYKNEPMFDSYTDHHWSHINSKDHRNHPPGYFTDKTFNINSLKKNI